MSVLARATLLHDRYKKQRLDVGELAEQLNYNEGTIRNKLSKGTLGITPIKEGKSVFFDIFTVAEHLEKTAAGAGN